MNLKDMTDIRCAGIVRRFLLIFVPERTERLPGWRVVVTYKMLFGRPYYVRAVVKMNPETRNPNPGKDRS